MSNPIQQVITVIASLITLLIAIVVFGPMLDGFLSGLVYDTIANPTGALLINADSLGSTVGIILVGWKMLSFFVILGVFSRLFLYLGFYTEEQGVY